MTAPRDPLGFNEYTSAPFPRPESATHPAPSATSMPRIVRTGTMRVDVTSADIWDDRLVAAVVALRPEDGDVRSLDGQRVRITIEPASSPEQAAPVDAPPAHGSPLDYLAELKGLLLGMLEARTSLSDEQTERSIRRCKSLANAATLAILSTQRGPR